jgi:hypothetical protein
MLGNCAYCFLFHDAKLYIFLYKIQYRWLPLYLLGLPDFNLPVFRTRCTSDKTIHETSLLYWWGIKIMFKTVTNWESNIHRDKVLIFMCEISDHKKTYIMTWIERRMNQNMKKRKRKYKLDNVMFICSFAYKVCTYKVLSI